LKGPVTNNNPEGSYLRHTTLFPLNFPANKIKTDPALIDYLNLGAFLLTALLLLKWVLESSALYHLEILHLTAVLAPGAIFQSKQKNYSFYFFFFLIY
jgi:hypothetical protein